MFSLFVLSIALTLCLTIKMTSTDPNIRVERRTRLNLPRMSHLFTFSPPSSPLPQSFCVAAVPGSFGQLRVQSAHLCLTSALPTRSDACAACRDGLYAVPLLAESPLLHFNIVIIPILNLDHSFPDGSHVLIPLETSIKVEVVVA